MSDRIDVHETGDYVFTMSREGALLAWLVDGAGDIVPGDMGEAMRAVRGR